MQNAADSILKNQRYFSVCFYAVPSCKSEG